MGRPRPPDAAARCRAASGRSSSPSSTPASATSSRCAPAPATCSRRPTRSRSRSRSPPRSASIVCDLGRLPVAATPNGWSGGAAERGWLDRPMSIYEVHLGSWARVPEEGSQVPDLPRDGRAARAVREGDGVHARRAAAGGGASVRRVVGLPGDRVLRPDDALRHARGLHGAASTPATHAGIGVHPRLGAGPLPADAHGLARFDGTALYEHEDPRQGEHRDWGTLDLQLRPQRGAQFPAVATRCSGWSDYHVDGLRVDAVASMLYLDYSREAASGFPTVTAGARTSRRSTSSSS